MTLLQFVFIIGFAIFTSHLIFITPSLIADFFDYHAKKNDKAIDGVMSMMVKLGLPESLTKQKEMALAMRKKSLIMSVAIYLFQIFVFFVIISVSRNIFIDMNPIAGLASLIIIILLVNIFLATFTFEKDYHRNMKSNDELSELLEDENLVGEMIENFKNDEDSDDEASSFGFIRMNRDTGEIEELTKEEQEEILKDIMDVLKDEDEDDSNDDSKEVK